MLPEISRVIDLLTAPLHSFNTMPLFIKVCFVISIGAVIGILAITSGIAIIKLIEYQLSRKNAFAKNHINKLLLNTVIPQANLAETDLARSGMTIATFNKADMSVKTIKRLLICELLNYRNNFSGMVAENTKRIYVMLSLQKEAFHRLCSRSWKVKVQALSELFRMDVAPDRDCLLHLLEDKNKYVRDHARLSLIKFTEDDPLQYLRKLNEPISQWESLEIFQLLQDKGNNKLSSLAALINDKKEHTVVSLCLKLAVHFNQVEAIPAITALINTDDLTLRSDAITTLGKMHSNASQAYLMNIYYGQPATIKLAIMGALGEIKSTESLAFLEKEFIAEDNFEIKKSASDAIIKLYPGSTETIDRLLANGKTFNNKILRHSLNPLINNK